MIKVIGVRFRTAGKIYFFDPLDLPIEKGGHVIVETARGIEFGTVVSAPKEVEDDKVIQPLKPVLRIATEKDMEQEAANKIKEKDAFKICLEKIAKHGLEMKLIDTEYTFDNNKVLFYFTADGRIDFRELVKDLASVFKTRIELRQIGVRDETKIMGGIGICGRPLCCHTHLSEFIPVSIKMAKEQNLSLNPTKISGVCGRLMCCLKHEEETYEELNRTMPGVGDQVTTRDGLKGEVASVNVLRQLVKVVVDVNDEKEIHEYKVADLHFKRKHGKKDNQVLSAEELRELQKLEEEEKMEAAEENALEVEDAPVIRQDKKRNQNRNNRRENQETRESGEKREKWENREGTERREKRVNHEGGEKREKWENREGTERREKRVNHEGGENREKRENREGRGNRGNREKRDRRPRFEGKPTESGTENEESVRGEGGNHKNRHFNNRRNHRNGKKDGNGNHAENE